MKKILVIESNKDVLENIIEILQLSSYKVIIAQNGKIGVEQAIKYKPDLILCDILMPELNGYGILHMVRKNPELERTPFIFLAEKTDHHETRRAMSFGADDYLTNPHDSRELLNAIESRLRKAELTKKKISERINGVNEMISFIGAEEMLKKLVEGRYVDSYKKGQRIFSEGNHPVGVYFVKMGKVKVFKINDTGKELILKIVDEGEFFGYVALFENTIYREFADALEDSEIVAISENEFEQLIHSNPEVSGRFIKLLAGDLAKRREQLIHVAYNSLRRKVADALVLLKEKFKDKPGQFTIHISRGNLAAIAGTAPESLIRTLTNFKAEGLIDIKDANITIFNEDKLRHLPD